MTDTAKLVIEVTAGVLPPEVQLEATCGAAHYHAEHSNPSGERCNGFVTSSSGWSRARTEAEHTRRWAVTSSEWHAASERDGGQAELLCERHGAATAYAQLLMLQPDRFNHVRVDWLWM